MNRYKLTHITSFEYDGPVSESYNEVRLRPREDEQQSVLSFKIQTSPISKPTAHLDCFGNWVHQFNVLPEHRRLRVEAESTVLVMEPLAPAGGLRMDEIHAIGSKLEDEFYDFVSPTDYVPHDAGLQTIARHARENSDGTVLGFAIAAAAYIHSEYRYEKGATHVASSLLDALSQGAGVCQDFTHLLLGVARISCLPARYVSGYLVPRKTAQAGASVEEVVGGQASHAWAEVYIPWAGWFGLDPTIGTPAGLQHVRLAYGRDYGDVAPVRGVYKGHAGQRLSVDVRVRPALDDEGAERLHETAAGPVMAFSEEAPQQQQ